MIRMPASTQTHTVITPDNKHKNVESVSPTTIEQPQKKGVNKPVLKWFKPNEDSSNQKSSEKVATLTPKRRFHFSKKFVVITSVVLILFLSVAGAVGAVGLHTYTIANNLKTQAMEAMVVGQGLKDQLKNQNLPGAEATMVDLQNRLTSMKTEYERLSFYQKVPIAKDYYADGLHAFAAGEAGMRAGLKSVDAIVPYADVLGFSGQGSFEGGTAENRIKLLLETLDKVTPVIDDITTELKTVESELAQIDPNRYPEKFQEYEVRNLITQAKSLSTVAVAAVTEFRPVIEVLPEIAGSDSRKKYLVIFQNDNELRPTGGFMTAYAVMFVEKGVVTPEKSDDIYELDKKFKKNIPIPPILGKYLTSEKRFNLRDMNIDPDFKNSMDTFYEHYKEVPGEPANIDGIISVDTTVLSDLVKILGPVEVPGYGTFTAENDPRCDCPQIIYVLSEIVDRPTPYLREDRKGIIAPMMQGILQKAYAAPNELWPQLFDTAWKKIEARSVQFYMFNEEYQAAAEKINAAGRLNPVKEGHDYIAVVDANLGGAKSNLFVEQSAKLVVSPPENGQIKNTLTLTYKNNRKGDNCNLEAGQLCLNAVLRDWMRVYVPEGATLTNITGIKDGSRKESTANGFTIFEGEFNLAPLSQSTVQLEYTVPYTDDKMYRLQLRKQAGTDPAKYLIDINGHEEEVILDKDKTITIDF